jgi:integrase
MSLNPTPDRELKIDSRTGIYYYRGTPVRGAKEITKSLGVRNFRTAVQAKREFLWSIRGIDPSEKDLLFRDYAKNVFLTDRKKKSKKTYEMAVYAVKALMPFFESYTMRQITDRAWDEYKEYSEQINPGRLLRYDRAALMMMLKKLQKKGIVREMPDLEYSDPGYRRRRALTKTEVDAILANSKTTLFGLCLFMIKMGCRPREALHAKWDEFDLLRGIWNIPAERTKTRTARSIKLNPTVLEWLLMHRLVYGETRFVFSSRLDSSRPVDSYAKQWSRMLKTAKLPSDISPYYLRHTFLTECAKRVRDGKVSLVQITTYAGTSIREFERTYLHIEGEDTKDVATIMEEK